MLSIVMKDVYVEDSHPGIYPLLTAAEASFEMNLIDAWKGDYVVQGLQLTDSETNLKSMHGQKQLYHRQAKCRATSVRFLRNTQRSLKTRSHYTDHINDQEHTYTSKNLIASIESTNDVYAIEMAGELQHKRSALKNAPTCREII